jgi:hypothetical protein
MVAAMRDGKQMRDLDQIWHFLLYNHLVEPDISWHVFYVSVASLSWSMDPS